MKDSQRKAIHAKIGSYKIKQHSSGGYTIQKIKGNSEITLVGTKKRAIEKAKEMVRNDNSIKPLAQRNRERIKRDKEHKEQEKFVSDTKDMINKERKKKGFKPI